MLYLTSSHNLIADAFFILDNRLMFASLHGRDADIWSFLATMQEGSKERLGFREPEDIVYYPMLTTASRFYGLVKRTTKYATHNFGTISHMFMYAEDLVELNHDAKTGWIIMDDVHADLDKAIWLCLQQLSDMPLLEHWRDRILSELSEQGCIRWFQPGISSDAAVVGILAASVKVPENFDSQLTEMLRNQLLLP